MDLFLFMSLVVESYFGSSEYKAVSNPGQDAHLSKVHSHPRPHSFRLGQFKHSNKPTVHVFGMWEKTSPWKNPSRCGRSYKLHAESGPAQDHIFSHQRYNKMTIFKNLLYSFSLLECLPYLCMLV